MPQGGRSFSLNCASWPISFQLVARDNLINFPTLTLWARSHLRTTKCVLVCCSYTELLWKEYLQTLELTTHPLGMRARVYFYYSGLISTTIIMLIREISGVSQNQLTGISRNTRAFTSQITNSGHSYSVVHLHPTFSPIKVETCLSNRPQIEREKLAATCYYLPRK